MRSSPTHAARVRYGQVWEDADVLLEALAIRPGDACFSIASAGDNTLAMLTRDPARVVAVDSNPAQIASLALRVAAYRVLTHDQLLELVGSRPSARRRQLYLACRPLLDQAAREFWDGHPSSIARGIGASGKFERYLALFRRLLTLVHGRAVIGELLQQGRPAAARRAFYRARWDTWRWRVLCRTFFSRPVMALLGRDPAYFQYAEDDVGAAVIGRIEYGLTELDPADNAYVEWILTGAHRLHLPLALRPEHFQAIRSRLDRLEWHCASLEQYLGRPGAGAFDCFNLSDVFEYMSPAEYQRALHLILPHARRGARLAYWNLLVSRRRPESLAARLRSCESAARALHRRDRAFFYRAFRLEEVL